MILCEFVIPSLPPSANDERRHHWSVRNRKAREYIRIAGWHARMAWGSGRKPASHPVIVTLHFSLPRGGDADNRAKYVCDGLKGVILVDDCAPWLHELRLRARRGKPGQVFVTVETAL